MAEGLEPIEYDFGPLLKAERPELLVVLAEAHSSLANLAVKIGFIRASEARDPKNFDLKATRVEFEALQTAYTEKKFLLYQLLKELD